MSGLVGEPLVMRPGMVLAGKYSLTREIGRGAVGLVFEAEHLRLRQKFAVKALNGHLKHELDLVQRFEREARAMALIKSPHITSVFDVDTTPDGTPYMVMELLEGHDFHRELRERPKMPAHEIISLMLQACEGLAVVHDAGIIHRDLKPSNLFLTQVGDTRVLKLMDFGISKIEGDDATLAGASLGTPAYMSPEQVRSPSDVDARTDLWALGVILFRALTGVLPFEGEGITGMSVAIVTGRARPIRDLRPDLPAELHTIVDRLLAKERSDRLQTARELRDALAPFADPAAIPSDQGPPSLRSLPPAPQTMSSLAGVLEPGIVERGGPAGTSFTPSSPPGVSSTVTSRRRAVTPWILAGLTAVVLVGIGVAPWLVSRSKPVPLPIIPPAVATAPENTPVVEPPASPPAPPPAIELDTPASASNTSAAASVPPSVTPPPRATAVPAHNIERSDRTERKARPAPPTGPTTPKRPDLPALL